MFRIKAKNLINIAAANAACFIERISLTRLLKKCYWCIKGIISMFILYLFKSSSLQIWESLNKSILNCFIYTKLSYAKCIKDLL